MSSLVSEVCFGHSKACGLNSKSGIRRTVKGVAVVRQEVMIR